jgi:hypothetical protein
MAEPNGMADYLQERPNARLVAAMLGRQNALMDGATPPNELAQYAPGYAFETDNPVINFLRRMNAGQLAPQQSMAGWLQQNPTAPEFAKRAPQLLMAIPHPATAWAARTPSAITGGKPRGAARDFRMGDDLSQWFDSSTGLRGINANSMTSELGFSGNSPTSSFLMSPRNADTLRRMMVLGEAENRNSPRTNLRTPSERGWWLRGPGGGD